MLCHHEKAKLRAGRGSRATPRRSGKKDEPSRARTGSRERYCIAQELLIPEITMQFPAGMGSLGRSPSDTTKVIFATPEKRLTILFSRQC
jgi:hypothetical protein